MEPAWSLATWTRLTWEGFGSVAAATVGWSEDVGPGPTATAHLLQQRGARCSAPSPGSLVEPIKSYATQVMHEARREMSMKSDCKVRQS